MRFTRLKVDWFAGIERAELAFGPGLNVLHGPNDLGKSTLAAAIRAALLVPAQSSYGQRYAPWHHDAIPSVELQFLDRERRAWRLRKTFGDEGGRAELVDARDGETFDGDVVKGREVDDSLRKLLQIGIASPGGKHAPRGLPESFLSKVLFADQTSVDAVLRGSLERDSEASGRLRLAEALQSLGHDPALKAALDRANEETDALFTEKGTRRRGKASKFQPVQEQMRVLRAELEEAARLSEQAVASAERVARCQLAVDAARASHVEAEARALEVSRARAAWALVVAAEARAAAANARVVDLDRRRRELDARDAAGAALAAKEGALAEEERLASADLVAAAEARHAAEEAARRAEDSDGLARREVARLELRARVTAGDERLRVVDARGADIAAARASSASLARSEEAAAAAERAVVDGAAAVERANVARVRVAARLALLRAVASRLARAAVAAIHARAEASRAQAVGLRGEATTNEAAADAIDAAAPLGLPDRAELRAIEAVDQARALALASASGLVSVVVRPRRSLRVSVAIDGAAERATVVDAPTTLEATRTMSLGIDELLDLEIATGSEETRRALREAEADWQARVAPALARAEVSSVRALAVAAEAAGVEAERSSRLRSDARAARARADQLDEGAVALLAAAPPAAVEPEDPSADAEAVDTEEVAREIAAGADQATVGSEATRRERELAAAVAAVAAAAGELGVRRDRAARAQGDAATARGALAAAAARACSGDDGEHGHVDFGALEAAVASERAAIAASREQSARALAAMDADAAGAARRVSEAVVEAVARFVAAEAREVRAREARGAARADVARDLGARDELRRGLAAEDAEAAARDLAGRAADLAALPRPPGAAPDDEAEAAASAALDRAARAVSSAEQELAEAAGAATVTGGASARERERAIREALHEHEEKERDLELDADAWLLLRETLRGVERDQAQHLGRALAAPVGARIAELTGDRYKLALGTALETTGVVGVPVDGLDDALAALSVGTKEQLATLLRVTIAEALGCAIVLDDHLVQSDAARLAWFRRLLREAATRTQVVVFTCKPEDYLSASDAVAGPVRGLDLTTVVRRILPG